MAVLSLRKIVREQFFHTNEVSLRKNIFTAPGAPRGNSLRVKLNYLEKDFRPYSRITWTKDQEITDQKSFAPPALAFYNHKLHMLHLGDSSTDMWYSVFDGANWTPNVKLEQQSNASPALAVYKDKLHEVHKGKSSPDLWHSVHDGKKWTPNVKIDQQSKASPALAVYKNKLHIVHLGKSSDDIWHSVFDGNSWSPNVKIGLRSSVFPALATYQGKLHMVFLTKGSHDSIWHAVYDGHSWTKNRILIKAGISFSPPSLASYNDKLHLIYVDVTIDAEKYYPNFGTIWHTTYNGHAWSKRIFVPDQKTKASSTLTVAGDVLCVAHLGKDSNNIWFSSLSEFQARIHPSVDINEMVRKFAPEARFHSQEECLPSSVPWLLEQVELRYEEKKTILPKGGRPLNMETLVGEHENGELSGSIDDIETKFALRISNETVQKGEPLDENKRSNAVCYSHVRPAPTSAAIDIQYWFFYPYNPQKYILGNHEGDWEHITVKVSPTADTILGVYFARHHSEGGWDAFYTNGTHPIVYSAKESHASYGNPGLHSRGDTGIGDVISKIITLGQASPDEILPDDDTNDSDRRWYCWERVINIGEKYWPLNEQSWLKFTGRWGESSGIFGSSIGKSPDTPSFKDSWHDDGGGPLAWFTDGPQPVCRKFDPQAIKAVSTPHGWHVAEESGRSLVWAGSEKIAHRIVAIIRFYGMNDLCGLPGTNFRYLLVNGKAPKGQVPGSLPNEDCLPIKPSTLFVKYLNGQWLIFSEIAGSIWNFNDVQSAMSALRLIKQYGFGFQCDVERPNPSFTFWRK